MDKDFFTRQMDFLAGAYTDRFIQENVLRTWYEVFKDIPGDIFKANCEAWVKLTPKAPTIAELLEECRSDVRKGGINV